MLHPVLNVMIPFSGAFIGQNSWLHKAFTCTRKAYGKQPRIVVYVWNQKSQRLAVYNWNVF